MVDLGKSEQYPGAPRGALPKETAFGGAPVGWPVLRGGREGEVAGTVGGVGVRG